MPVRSKHITYRYIDLSAIILKIVSLHDLFLRAAWACHWLLKCLRPLKILIKRPLPNIYYPYFYINNTYCIYRQQLTSIVHTIIIHIRQYVSILVIVVQYKDTMGKYVFLSYISTLNQSDSTYIGICLSLTEVAGEGGPHLAPQKFLLSQKFRHLMRCKKYLENFFLSCLVSEIQLFVYIFG